MQSSFPMRSDRSKRKDNSFVKTHSEMKDLPLVVDNPSKPAWPVSDTMSSSYLPPLLRCRPSRRDICNGRIRKQAFEEANTLVKATMLSKLTRVSRWESTPNQPATKPLQKGMPKEEETVEKKPTPTQPAKDSRPRKPSRSSSGRRNLMEADASSEATDNTKSEPQKPISGKQIAARLA